MNLCTHLYVVALLCAFSQSAEAWPWEKQKPKAFVDACSKAGIWIYKQPVQPVNSIALEYSPHLAARTKRRYEFTGDRLSATGALFWQPRIELQMPMSEFRDHTVWPDGTQKIYRFQQPGGKASLATEFTADVLAIDTVEGAEQLTNALWKQNQVIHNIVVHDRRDNSILAKMVFITDLSKNLGCGLNVKDGIDIDVFILKASGIKIAIPPYEQERRSRAIIKNWDEY